MAGLKSMQPAFLSLQCKSRCRAQLVRNILIKGWLSIPNRTDSKLMALK
jgi:hypothetical protein